MHCLLLCGNYMFAVMRETAFCTMISGPCDMQSLWIMYLQNSQKNAAVVLNCGNNIIQVFIFILTCSGPIRAHIVIYKF